MGHELSLSHTLAVSLSSALFTTTLCTCLPKSDFTIKVQFLDELKRESNRDKAYPVRNTIIYMIERNS